MTRSKFQLQSTYKPTGDQPQAIKYLVNGTNAGMKHQVLLGVTGSGKTFSMANVIAQINKPTLVISHNKTLAAQLYQEYKEFFPNNAVEYFVSYYDYYQPEAYLPQTDTYIEKDADINEDIDKMRLSTTTSLMTRSDVIVVASVSCIYNLGSPIEYKQTVLPLKEGMPLRPEDVTTRLIQLFYQRSDFEFKRGVFRVTGDTIDIYPAYLDFAVRLEITNGILSSIKFIDPVSGRSFKQDHFEKKRKGSYYKELSQDELKRILEMKAYGEFTLYPAKHYVANADRREAAITQIKTDLINRLAELHQQGRRLEAHRLKQKTEYDLEMLTEIGYCKGIENYSRYFDGRSAGTAPYSLLDFFPQDDFLTIIDESHITVPQINGMYHGDRSRKETLIDFGFRLPSALDNRPLRFEEFLQKTPQIVHTSATPNEWEVTQALYSYKANIKGRALKPDYSKTGIVEQLIRPTGLIDPEIQVRGSKNQVENLIDEIKLRTNHHQRVLVTTLTKRMAEDLSEFLQAQDVKVQYLHSDIDTLDRVDILDDLRRGKYDVLVGINLLREGLDLPEVSLVAILDADKEGFLRSETALVQTMGRAARHQSGMVIMYADKTTGSMQRAIDEVNRRRKIQEDYNQKHGITPQSIEKPFREKIIERSANNKTADYSNLALELDEMIEDNANSYGANTAKILEKLQHAMDSAAENLEFERAALIRDRIDEVKRQHK